MQKVTVVIGAGAIGIACARRVSSGRHIVLADLKARTAHEKAELLRDAGFNVTDTTVDVADKNSVILLAELASSLGTVDRVIHAAGVSPSQAPPQTILNVDLYGTALVLEVFGNIIDEGGSGIVIASQSGHRMPALTTEQDKLLAITPTNELLALDMLGGISDPLLAYQMSKRANVLRVKAESVKWGHRGARVNAISPGIIITPLARDELHGPRGDGYRKMIESSNAKRAGTADEVAALAELIMGEAGAFISGSDFLIDGGTTAAYFLADSV